MTDGADDFIGYLKAEYQKAGFPNPRVWGFSAENEEQKLLFARFRGQQLIRQITEELWVLTDRGAGWLLEQIPVSAEASRLWSDRKAAYVQAGRPKRRTWTFSPADPSEEPAYSELRARGYIEQLNEELFILSATGMNKSAGS